MNKPNMLLSGVVFVVLSVSNLKPATFCGVFPPLYISMSAQLVFP